MRDILIVAKFSMKDILRKKSFIVSTIIILLLIVVGFQIPRIIKWRIIYRGEMNCD